MHTKFSQKTDMGDLGADRIILKCILKTGYEIVKWVHMAQDRGQWRALVHTVMDLRVP
jgi:hypothetical protein